MKSIWSLLLIFTSTHGFHKPMIESKFETECPEGWDLIPHNNHCYFLVNRPMPHKLAQKYCSLLATNAHLARVRNREQNDLLQEYAFSVERIWLQAKAKFDIIDSRASLNSPGYVLRWKNGNPVSFTNWMNENGFEHMSSKQLCVIMNRHGKWLNADCGQTESFVCEMKSSEPNSDKYSLPLKCPTNWTFNVKTSACYMALSENNFTWLDADRRCGEEGAKNGEEAVLVSVHSAGENQFLIELAQKEFPNFEYVMLGAIGYSGSANQWDWIDTSSFTLFSNWQQNKPAGSKKAAVLFMKPNGKWINSYADRRFGKGSAVAICKFLTG